MSGEDYDAVARERLFFFDTFLWWDYESTLGLATVRGEKIVPK